MDRGGSVRTSRPGLVATLALAYAVANLPFVWKYGTRAGLPQEIAIPAFLAWIVALFWQGPRLAGALAVRDRSGRAYAGVVLVAAAALAVVMSRFDPDLIRVTRAPAIHEWLERLLRGEYPYASLEMPSSFPVTFLLALPFDRLGDVGMLEIAAFLAFAWLCWRGAAQAPDRAWLSLGLLLGSPLFLYEIATRSELFANMTLLVAFLWLLERRPLSLGPVAVGALGGLVLSTRGVVGLAYAVFLPWRFRGEPARGAIVGFAIVATFVLTWLPFALWDTDRFARFGPFAIQMSYIPAPALAVCCAVAAAAGFTARDARDAYVRAGGLLMAVIAGLLAHAVWSEGWSQVLLEDHFDISYFAFGQTLLLYAVARGALHRADAVAVTPGSGR